ncbi:RagB/SusD family nutrient uptake outer membrane protein [Chitinophaga solisilvae]|uniref:RagB/SusD family nutrient uptake outer membrane protein n=1 Tax=Chitinophaga solisilvae TaxID=1233460 RepID=UPI001370815C|nr:RagB/SusD family nutrient uptake outer membrane protein [Chitinophaga solisilvae]
MKYKYLTPVLLMIAVLTGSCNKLLDIKPVNSMMPVSIADYESVLLGGYPRTDFFMRTEMMTDNVYANLGTTYTAPRDQELWFTWAPYKQLPGVEDDPCWGQLYSSIFYANTVLDEFSSRTPAKDEQELFETVKGEAYALRAFSYFYLVNFYAEPYSEATRTAHGVPMPLTAKDVHQHTQQNVREPLEKVYRQIIADMDQAASLLAGKKSRSKFRFDASALQLLRARVYLFMGENEKAVAAASDVITTKPLSDMNTLQAHIDAAKSDVSSFSGNFGVIDGDYKNEVLFYMGGTANTNIFHYPQYMFKPTQELLNLTLRQDSTSDYRRYIFSSFYALNTADGVSVGPTVYYMYARQENPSYYIGLKVSEAYVIRAEANIKLKQPAKAITDLNNLLVRRMKKGRFTPLQAGDFADDAALMRRVLEERRVELAFEGGMRWMDLRRLGKPALTHVYKNGQVYELKQGDPRYLLQIPMSEQNNSPDMPLNPF